MLKKNGILLSFFAGSMFFAMSAAAEEVAVIRAEDEDLLQGVMIEEMQVEEPVAENEVIGAVYYPMQTEEEPVLVNESRQEWFDPSLLPTNRKKAEEQQGDLSKQGFLDAINACMDDVKDRLYMERGMFDNGMRQSVTYLSQTMAEINQCYENVGHEIIATYYNNDRTLAKSFDKKVADFYINGTDVNFNPQFCGENCSMSDILDAQMEKFAEFRIYLYQLLDNGVGSR